MKLVCFGDSITARTEGHERALLTIKLEEKLGEDWKVINAGVPGDNTFDALERIEKDVLIHHPDFVTVLFGANDAGFHKMVKLDDYASNLIHIATSIDPKKTVLISPAPVDESLQEARTNSVLKQYAEVVREVSVITGSYFIDLFTNMIEIHNLTEILRGQLNDGLHFGELGYDYLSDMISKELLLLSGSSLN